MVFTKTSSIATCHKFGANYDRSDYFYVLRGSERVHPLGRMYPNPCGKRRGYRFSIAEQYFGDHQKWSLIYYGNQGKLNGSLIQFAPGTELNIPCLLNVKATDTTPLQQDDAEMKLVTGSDYAPFTDRDWLGQGMVTELVNAALENTPNPVSYSITWEDD